MSFQRGSSRFGLLAGAFVIAAVFGGACSATGNPTTFTGAGGSGGGSTSSNESTVNGTANGGGDLISGAAGTGGSSGSGVGGGCAASQNKAEQVPLDMYIMLDKSGSMKDMAGNTDKWTAVTMALQTFLSQPGTNGISVGIQYFALPLPICPLTCNTSADCGGVDPICGTCLFGVCTGFGAGGGDSCKASDYATPAVEIAELPGSAGAIILSIGAQKPKGGTPTSAALDGAITHAKEWATAHPTHLTIAVLATDGDPADCDTNLANINAIAAAGVNSMPKIATYVIGVGDSLDKLNGIAAAGGTGQALLVDANQNAGQAFLDAMNKIRNTALSCSYLIPKPVTGTPDFDSVNVQYTPGAGAPEVFPKVTDQGQCPASGNAWYYDNNGKPTQIILCKNTCDKLSKDAKGQVQVLLGCKTIVK